MLELKEWSQDYNTLPQMEANRILKPLTILENQ